MEEEGEECMEEEGEGCMEEEREECMEEGDGCMEKEGDGGRGGGRSLVTSLREFRVQIPEGHTLGLMDFCSIHRFLCPSK